MDAYLLGLNSRSRGVAFGRWDRNLYQHFHIWPHLKNCRSTDEHASKTWRTSSFSYLRNGKLCLKALKLQSNMNWLMLPVKKKRLNITSNEVLHYANCLTYSTDYPKLIIHYANCLTYSLL